MTAIVTSPIASSARGRELCIRTRRSIAVFVRRGKRGARSAARGAGEQARAEAEADREDPGDAGAEQRAAAVQHPAAREQRERDPRKISIRDSTTASA